MTSIAPSTVQSAFSDKPDHWLQIDWKRVNRNVRGMQVRIAKATKEGDWRRVKALQRYLTRSLSGKALAVRRVTENQGKRTPGIDGVVWSTPTAKCNAIGALESRGYRPLPLRRVHIPKKNGKLRPLGIPTMKDRAMQALYLLALLPVSETIADRNSYGFRPERCTADAIEQCHKVLARSFSAQWVLEADIKGCFDNIDHQWLIDHVPMDKVVLRKWLKAGVVETGRLLPTEAGTPQGGIISPTLANLALDGLVGAMEAVFGAPGSRLAARTQVNVIRYADDFVITGCSKELLENEVKPLVVQFLAQRGLVLAPEKTRVNHIDDGFDFLGWNVRKYNGKLLIKPSKGNVKAFLDKVRGVIRVYKTATQENLIRQLNPIIRGWANYHRSQVASAVFSRADHLIWQSLWRWAKRRHPNKGARWVKKKYFHRIGNRDWTFAATLPTDVPQAQRKAQYRALVRASETKIRRHVKIRSDANPFDPADEFYFEERKSATMLDSVSHRHELVSLLKQQWGRCALCGESITRETGWHDHHLVYRVHGGGDQLFNRVLLHPVCHQQVHHLKLSVTKPAPQGVQ
ncbi:group II intron reverse transcriptase/maturase [Noviherbaspirillum denitrificans]|uniref:Group II intron reverse transcriptase/maturase n=1 Tax=Noviherbaspirillum denitrificans TaxID=1968433 RepID=A0A254TF16_9BURK|nr:group II intron reverse transcriptase/maturase [Noviherbaspirillum denitrificans]OWW21125.1 group II intron reverse transcriptase/maturase [Noviherbaspirillum denitrificans]